jgi:hypothetical protein
MHTLRTTLRQALALAALAVTAPETLMAQTTQTTAATGGLTNPLNKIETLPQFLNAILDAVVNLGTIILILALVYVGFQFVVAQGNEEKLKSARSALMWTVIGGLVLLGAKSLGLVIQGTVESLK